MNTAQLETLTDTIAQPAIWLRDNCPCAECRDPRNGQKLFAITDLDADLTVTAVAGTTVTFSDGHVSLFDPAFLTAEQAPPGDRFYLGTDGGEHYFAEPLSAERSSDSRSW